MPIDARNVCANNLVFTLVCDLSIGAISNDLERTLTMFSRSRHSLTLINISQTATDTAIVTIEGKANRKTYPSFQMVPFAMTLSDL